VPINTRGETTSPPGVKRYIDPTRLDNNLRSTYLSPLRRANNTQKRTVLTLFARSLNVNPTT